MYDKIEYQFGLQHVLQGFALKINNGKTSWYAFQRLLKQELYTVVKHLKNLNPKNWPFYLADAN